MVAAKDNKKRSVLGRGLSALISSPAVPVEPAVATLNARDLIRARELEEAKKRNRENAPELEVLEGTVTEDSGPVRYLGIDLILNNASQPRQEFKEEELAELSSSIKTLGVLQPILVRPLGAEKSGKYEIVAGERRWRAAKRAGLNQVPVIIKELDDRATLEISIVENVQRENLSALEQAKAYQRLADEFSLNQQDIAERVGKDRSSVTNFMRLLKLPAEVQNMLNDGTLSMGHAKAILTVKEPGAQLNLARKVSKEGLSVRALEAIVGRVVVLDPARKANNTKSRRGGKIGSFPEVIDKLRNALGTKVQIQHHKSGRGKIEIEYFSEQELDRIIEKILA